MSAEHDICRCCGHFRGWHRPGFACSGADTVRCLCPGFEEDSVDEVQAERDRIIAIIEEVCADVDATVLLDPKDGYVVDILRDRLLARVRS